MAKRQVFLAYTQAFKKEKELLRIYSKSSHQEIYNWISDLAERYGNGFQPFGLKYPTTGTGKIVMETRNDANGQHWWVERHEVI